jgi:hypothetical protein
MIAPAPNHRRLEEGRLDRRRKSTKRGKSEPLHFKKEVLKKRAPWVAIRKESGERNRRADYFLAMGESRVEGHGQEGVRQAPW